jgi:hypothetical protein
MSLKSLIARLPFIQKDVVAPAALPSLPDKCHPSQITLEWKLLLERDIDVNAIRDGQIHLWPIIWIYAGLQLVSDADSALARWTSDATHAERRERLRKDYLAAEQAARGGRSSSAAPFVGIGSLWRPRRAIDHGIAVYALPSQHYLKLGEAFFAPMVDPFVAAARPLTPVSKLEWVLPDSFARQPRVEPTFGLLNRPFPAGLPDVSESVQADVAAFVARIAAHGRGYGLSISAETEAAIITTSLAAWQNVRNIERDFRAHFDVQPPRYLFLSCFHHDVAWGIRLAAQAVGAPCFDLQHGFAGEFNWQNSHWSALPPEGYALLPDAFLTWDRRSSDHATRYWPENGHPHRVIEIGRPDLAMVLGHPDGVKQRADFGAIVAPWPRKVLVALSSAGQGGLSSALISAIKSAPPDWLWLIRCHPVAKDPDLIPSGVMARLMAEGIGNALTYEPSSYPLAVVLSHTDHHVTGFSSTVLDAAGLGVPTTFSSPLSRMLTDDLIRDGLAAYAETPEAILASIAENARHRKALAAEPLAVPGTAALEGLMRDLLAAQPPG